ncbi:MAG: hypothetical protein ACFFCH_09475 [Promethearchaeota archaeon]
MDRKLRIGFVFIVFACGIISGTMVESIMPLNVISEPSIVIFGLSNETVLNSTQLYARNFRLIVQISEGGPVRMELIQSDGIQTVSRETSDTLLIYGAFFRRGIFDLHLFNLNDSLLVLRITMDLFGEDREQLWIGVGFFILGFAISVVYLVINWSDVVRRPQNSFLT